MATVAERLALAQMAAVWTASIVLEVRWGVGEVMVTRRRRSIWVGPEPVRLEFPLNDVAGQERLPVRDPEKRNIPRQTTGPATRWFLSSTAPVHVTQIDLIRTEGGPDVKTHVLKRNVLLQATEAFPVGAVMGAIIVPIDYQAIFVLERDQAWAKSLPTDSSNRK